jgi:hypothetical protein
MLWTANSVHNSDRGFAILPLIIGYRASRFHALDVEPLCIQSLRHSKSESDYLSPYTTSMRPFFVSQDSKLGQVGLIMAVSIQHTMTHTHTRAPGRISMNEWLVRHRGHYIHNRRTSISSTGFEPAIPAIDRLQAYALESTATRIDMLQRASKSSDILHSLHSVTFAHLMEADRHELNNLLKTTRIKTSLVLAVCFVSAINSDLSSGPHCTLWNKNIAYLEKRLRSLTCNIIWALSSTLLLL